MDKNEFVGTPSSQPPPYTPQPHLYPPPNNVSNPSTSAVYVPTEVVYDAEMEKTAFRTGWIYGFIASLFFGPCGAMVLLHFNPKSHKLNFPIVRARTGVMWGVSTMHWIALPILFAIMMKTPFCPHEPVDPQAISWDWSCIFITVIVTIALLIFYGIFAIAFTVGAVVMMNNEAKMKAVRK